MEQIKRAIEEAKHVVFLTGAGISTDSGIPDYRGAKGVGQEVNFEKILSAQAFREDPEEFWDNMFNIMKWSDLALKKPNIGHEWIASLETPERKVTVITQNIDGLHEKARSLRVINVHGTISEGKCPKCGHHAKIGVVLLEERVPLCSECNAILKPSVVLYGEDLPNYIDALSATNTADVFITMGTSLKVYPVNGLIENAKYVVRAQTFIINNEPTEKIGCASKFYQMPIVDFVKEFNQ